nr:retrovirus-related Pol polyprotein from transposon TNT 1-94 [Tanacetum cinerariifolium]
MEAIEKRYAGYKESKKVHKTLLKQQFENFAASSSETLDQTFNRLQKLTIQLEIQGEVIKQEDINLKLLRSLPSEWKTHALIWKNKAEIETISLDDFTNNTSNTNEADNTAYGVSTAHIQEDLEQINPDNLEEMDLHWEMAMLTIRDRRVKDTTAREKAVVSENIRRDANAVKALACWETNAILLVMKIMMVDLFPLEMVKVEYLEKNGVAERKNRTLIEAARTMLVDSKLPTTFWAEAVNTACYVLNRALVIKPHNKTPHELIRGRPPLIDFMKPFGCPVTILNIRDYLGMFDEKANEGFFIRYSVVSKAMRVFNKRTRIVEETLNIRFLKNAPNVKENRPNWLFDIDSLTISMTYVLVVAVFQTNDIAGTKDNIVEDQAEKKKEHEQEYILIPIFTTDPLISQGPKDSAVNVRKKATEVHESQVSKNGKHDDQVTRSGLERILQQERQTEHINRTNSFNTISLPVNTAGPTFVNAASPSPINAAGTPTSTYAFKEHPFERFSPFKNEFSLPHVPIVTLINDTGIFGNAYDDEAVEKEVDVNNVVSSYTIPDAPLIKFLKDHPKDQVIVKDKQEKDKIETKTGSVEKPGNVKVQS